MEIISTYYNGITLIHKDHCLLSKLNGIDIYKYILAYQLSKYIKLPIRIIMYDIIPYLCSDRYVNIAISNFVYSEKCIGQIPFIEKSSE